MNLAYRVVLEPFDLLQSVLNDAECLWVNACSRRDLVDLSVLGFERLFDRFKLFLQNQVAQTRLLVNFIDYLVELVKQSITFLFKIMELLELDLVLPFFVFELSRYFSDFFLLLFQLCFYCIMFFLFLLELYYLG